MSDSPVDTAALAALLANVGSNPERLERVIRNALASSPKDGNDIPFDADLKYLSDSLRESVERLNEMHQERDAGSMALNLMVRSFRHEAQAYQKVFSGAILKANILSTVMILLLLFISAMELFINWNAYLYHQNNVQMRSACTPTEFSPYPTNTTTH